MDELIRTANADYSQHEEVLLKRDRLRKEAFQWEQEYVRTFGEKILRIFKLKISCIRKKKTIAFCQLAINQGRPVNRKELEHYLDTEMAQYQKELARMLEDYEATKKTVELTELELLEIRKIYRRLAKKLHPDINKNTETNAELRELWERICIAYRCNQLDALQELEVLASVAMQAGGELDLNIPDIAEKIAAVEKEIERIQSTDPYQYKFLLTDKEAVSKKKEAMDEEYASYEAYDKQLEEVLQQMMEGGLSFVWQMN